MIKTWTIKNFKSVYDQINLEMAPLTVFAGANSSGKSTIIQSLLLTAQTVQSPVYARSVVLNGHILRLGTFDDIVSNNSNSNEIMIGFVLKEQSGSPHAIGGRYYHHFYPSAKQRATEIECEYSFSTGEIGERDVLQLQPNLEKSIMRVTFTPDDDTADLNTEEFIIHRSKKSIESRIEELQLKSISADIQTLEYEVEKFDKNIFRMRRYGLPIGRPVGASLMHFLPQRLAIVYDAVDALAKRISEAFVDVSDTRYFDKSIMSEIENWKMFNDDFRNIVIETLKAVISELPTKPKWEYPPEKIMQLIKDFSDEGKYEKAIQIFHEQSKKMSAPIRKIINQKIGERRDDLKKAAKVRRPEQRLAYIPLSDSSDYAVDYIQHYFSSKLKYLGPLRDEPKPVYPLLGAIDPKDIGFTGENTAAVLDVHRKTQIEYIPSKSFEYELTDTQAKTSTLRDAVLDWLEYMGIASKVETTDKGKLGHELKVSPAASESLHDLTHVGVGVSQVLPILVLSLIADKESTLIFEQPELHLHPRVQTRLADFFVSMTMLGKQCIVETHSEYLLNQLRYRSVASEGNKISDNIIIYFVEKNRGRSIFRPIRIDKYGYIQDWPKGFFDENERNAAAILKASMDKRKKELGSGNG